MTKTVKPIKQIKQTNTLKQLKKTKASLIYLQRQEARMKTLKSKRDTRRKIQLGELIKKAGLDTEENSVLYGLLLEAQEKLQSKNSHSVRQHWRITGDSQEPDTAQETF